MSALTIIGAQPIGELHAIFVAVPKGPASGLMVRTGAVNATD